MRYLALAADYDGTVASHDRVSEKTIDALERLRNSGRRAILVTGRRLDDLLAVCTCVQLFDIVVAENGGVVFHPATREETRLANPPPKALIQGLKARGVAPLEIGQVLVATLLQHRETVQDVVWELGLETQVIANRGAVMVLPAGINKATGLAHALRNLSLSRHEVAGIGNAENDHSFLALCECAFAVADAVPSLKREVARVTTAKNGNGVIELIDELIANDLSDLGRSLEKHYVDLGTRPDGRAVQLPPYGYPVLVAGPSGCGKSTFADGVIGRLIEKDYQVCIVDPEGDYGSVPNVVALGNHWRSPNVNEALSILEDPKINLSVNLLGISLNDRPKFLAQLIPSLQAMRARTGRPHWIVLDEAHHMLPTHRGHAGSALPQQLGETILVTVHPDHLTRAALVPIQVVVAMGRSPKDTLTAFGNAAGRPLVWPETLAYDPDYVVVWFVGSEQPPFAMRPLPGRAERIRHRRKYAEGDLKWHSFYFRGPDNRHNLKAQNLTIFCQIAEGIGEETWLFHLRRGDYSRWLRFSVRDLELADATEAIEHRADLTPQQTRQMITEMISVRYTLAV
ncbi:MAG TPA: HAD family hydrolase [Alphaproteobacteria bacterium]|jgi:hydroxymethylpyrimidine pyrophosphatase-like HAD family hydrolase|nr:HAD family hydrolase [Alphaproteobacteria bacterium]